MLSIPLFFFLFIYFAIVAFLLVFLFVCLYHIVTTGEFTIPSFAMTAFTFGAVAFTLILTWVFLAKANIDWRAPLNIFNTNWTTPPSEFSDI